LVRIGYGPPLQEAHDDGRTKGEGVKGREEEETRERIEKVAV
jgi:hypothetical protein